MNNTNNSNSFSSSQATNNHQTSNDNRVLSELEQLISKHQLDIYQISLDIEADQGFINRANDDLSDLEVEIKKFSEKLYKWKTGYFTVDDSSKSPEEKRKITSQHITFLSIAITRFSRKKHSIIQRIDKVQKAIDISKAEIKLLELKINSIFTAEAEE